MDSRSSPLARHGKTHVCSKAPHMIEKGYQSPRSQRSSTIMMLALPQPASRKYHATNRPKGHVQRSAETGIYIISRSLAERFLRNMYSDLTLPT